jgi:anti-sigma factor RsiW
MAMSTPMREVDREIEDLLPFYHNGRLTPAERARVDAALADDAELRRRLDLVAEEASASITANEALGAPSPLALEALMAKIEAEPKSAAQRLGAVKMGFVERIGGFLAALSPRTLAFATAAAVGVIALQGAMLSGLVNTGPRNVAYETASAPAEATGTFVLISFVPEAKAGQIADVLQKAGASIVEGPRASGLYRLRLSDKVLPIEEIGRIIARLQAARGVVALVAADH